MMSGAGGYAQSGEWIDLKSAANLGSGNDWGTPNNALLSDDAWATQTGNGKSLALTNLAKKIPAGATIVGIKVRHERHKDVGSIVGAAGFFLTKDGINLAGNVYSGAATPDTTDAVEEIGTGTTDMWGTTWTVDEINASTFGVMCGMQVTSGTYYLDHVQIAVWYN